MKLKRIDHMQVSVPVGSEEECRRFYGQILGLQEIPKPEPLRVRGGVWFLLGDVALHMGAENAEDRAASRRHFAIEVENLDEARVHLAAHHVPMIEEPIQIPDWERFYCRDPFGNRIEFMQRRS